ncbi:MAG: hypothetical protein ACJ8HI_09330 [Massilia sp.]
MSHLSSNTADTLATRGKRWLTMLAMVAGNLSSELVNPWACRLVKPAQQRTEPASPDRQRRARNNWPHNLD